MKTILSLIISGALVVSGFGQTRNVLVGTNNAVVQPTNFWSADSSNARTGLGLGSAATNDASFFQTASLALTNLSTNNGENITNLTASSIVGTISLAQGGTGATNAENARTALGLNTAATNPSSAFQPASSALTNIASNNGGSLTNISANSIVGIIPATNISAIDFTNIGGTLPINSGGTGATNAASARQNLGSTTVGDAVFIATNAEAARTAIGALGATSNGSGLTNLTAANITGTVALASNVTGTIAISNGGSGATTAGGARTNLGLGAFSTNALSLTSSAVVLSTNFLVTNGPAFFAGGGSYFATFGSTNSGFSSFIGGIGYFHKGTNIWYVDTNGLEFSAPSVVRSNLGLSFAALTNTNASNFRTAIGATAIGEALFTATNSAMAINAIGISTNFSDQILSVSNIFIGAFPSGSGLGFVVPTSGKTLTVAGTNVSSGTPAFFGWNGFSGAAFSAAESRTNLGLNAWTTNTNSPVFVGTNGEVVSPTNFWQVAPIVTRFVEFDPPTNASTNIVAARNLHIHSLAISRTGVTSTIVLPTNGSTFNGDIALVVHQGPTSSVTQVRTAGSTNNLVAMNSFDEAVEFVYYNNVWQFNHNRSFIEPIYFSGTNAAANAAASRTNLGLGANANVTFAVVNSGGFVSSSVIAGTTNDSLELISEETNSAFLNYRNSNAIASTLTFTPTQFIFDKPINFDNTTNAATTRTNLGLGATNNVEFNNITIADSLLTLSAGGEDDVFVRNESGNLELEANSSIIAFSPVVASSTLTATSTVTAKTNLVVEGFVDFSTNQTNSNPATNNQINDFIEIRVGTNQFWLPVYK